MDEKLLTVKDLAAYLQVCPTTIYRILRRARLPHYRVGNRWRFRKEEIDAWLEENRVTFEADKKSA